MSQNVKRCLYIAGLVLAVLSVLFVGERLKGYAQQINLTTYPFSFWCIIGGACVFYGVVSLSLPMLWLFCLRHGEQYMSIRDAVVVYGYTQIGKYLPGNIMHLASREVLAMMYGLAGKAVALSIVKENIILIAVTCCVFLLPSLVYFMCPHLHTTFIILYFFVSCIVTIKLSKLFWGEDARNAVCCALFFFICMAMLWLVVLCCITSFNISINLAVISSMLYVAAWLIGFVTPGAPAGLGVREGAMLLLSQNYLVHDADILISCLLCRIICVVGDFLFFLYSIMLHSRFVRSK